VESWSEDERLTQEKLTLGLYLTGHPITRHEPAITPFISDRLGPLAEKHDRTDLPEQGYGRRQENRVVIAGLVVELRMKQNKSGKRMAFMTLDDRTGRIEVALFSETYERFKEYVVKDQLVVVEGLIGWDDFQGQVRLSAESLMRIGEARAKFAKRLQIRWDQRDRKGVSVLKELLAPYQGGECPVFIERHLETASAVIQLGDSWRVTPKETLIEQLRHQFGESAVRLRFD
jgi:DNA polymerase-3 subunit alpha